MFFFFFFFNDTATTEIYTLSLHDALPILKLVWTRNNDRQIVSSVPRSQLRPNTGRTECYRNQDRKSTRLNSSHANISYAVFCLKKKKTNKKKIRYLQNI